MNATMDRRYYGFRTSADRTIGVRSGICDGSRKHCSSLSDISTSFETCVPAKRSSVEDRLERSISAVCRAWGAWKKVPERKGPRTDWSLTAGCRKCCDVWPSTMRHSWVSEGQTSLSTVHPASLFGTDDPRRKRRASWFGTDDPHRERGTERADSETVRSEYLGVCRRCKGRVHPGAGYATGWVRHGLTTRQWTWDAMGYDQPGCGVREEPTASVSTRSRPTKSHRNRRQLCWQCSGTCHLRRESLGGRNQGVENTNSVTRGCTGMKGGRPAACDLPNSQSSDPWAKDAGHKTNCLVPGITDPGREANCLGPRTNDLTAEFHGNLPNGSNLLVRDT
jgi:hypothetical protein